MKLKYVFLTIFSFVLFVGISTQVQATEQTPLDTSSLYVPDMTDARFAEAFDASVSAHGVLPHFESFWGDLVNAADTGNDGSGVYVAVLDTGLLEQWEFLFSEANVADHLGKGFTHTIYWDAALGDVVIGPLREDRGFITELASGHGTHVASTVAGFNLNNSAWVEGVAPGVTIIPVLVLDAWLVDSPFGTLTFSGGTDAMVAAGIMYVADLAETLDGPVVINMSLGGPDRSAEIEAAVDYAISKGVVVVASAGNSGAAGMGYPGGLPQIISAAAAGWTDMFNNGWLADAPEDFNTTDSLGNNWQIYLEDFSSRPLQTLGQKHPDLDVAAPGAWVVGPYKSAFANNFGYYYLSGTSMAAPHVAATAAQVLETHPDLSHAEMEFILKLAARGNPIPASDAVVAFPFIPDGSYTATWDGGDYGAGFLQVDQALDTANVQNR